LLAKAGNSLYKGEGMVLHVQLSTKKSLFQKQQNIFIAPTANYLKE
jgi:hypothetical protein